MLKLIKQSGASFGLQDDQREDTTVLPLEKRSDAREAQLNWLEEQKHIHPKVVEWAKQNPADPDKEIHSVVVPLGASESWAETFNGDAFEREWLAPAREDWGHLTFEKNGRAFMHHCFVAGSLVLMHDYSTKPIEKVEQGEYVITRKGPRKVLRTMRRDYRGSGVRIRVNGASDAIEATSDHLFWSYRYEDIHCPHKRYRNALPGPSGRPACNCESFKAGVGLPDWREAKDLRAKDYLVLPKPTHGTESVEPEFARLVGWVAADGCLDRDGVRFTFSEKSEEKIERVSQCLRSNGLSVGTYEGRDDGLIQFYSNSREMVRRLEVFISGKKSEKYITTEILRWDRDSLLHMLSAFIDADGHVARGNRNEGQLRIRSSSEKMLHTLKMVILSLGVPCTVNMDSLGGLVPSPVDPKKFITASPSGCVAVSKTFASLVTPHSFKHLGAYSKKRQSLMILDDCFLIRVRDVETVRLDEPVFNLEVEEHHEYVINGVLAHNCNSDPSVAFGDTPCMAWNSRMDRAEGIFRLDLEKAKQFGAHRHVMRMLGPSAKYPSLSMGAKVPYDVCSLCGNKAPTVEDYCEHPKNPGMGNINPETGELMCVFNPEPWFFDLSIVIIKAAVEALVLGPVLNAMKAAAHYREKESGITVVPSAVLAQDMYMADAGSRQKTSTASQTMKLSDIIKEIPVLASHVLHPVRKKEPEISASGLASMGLGKTSMPGALSSLAGLGILLNPREFADMYSAYMPGSPTGFSASSFQAGFKRGDGSCYVSPEFVQLGPVSTLAPLMPSRSMMTPFLLDRVWRNLTEKPVDFSFRVPHSIRSKLAPSITSFPSQPRNTPMGVAYGTYVRQAIDGLAAVIEMAASLSSVASRMAFGSSWDRMAKMPQISGTADAKRRLSLQAGLIPAYVGATCGQMAGQPVMLHALNQLRSPNIAPLIGGIL